MTDVIKFPPVPYVAFENTIDNPLGVSLGISGTPKASQIRPTRRTATAVVPGVLDQAGAYVEALKRIVSETIPFVELELLPFYRLQDGRSYDVLGLFSVEWKSGDAPLNWTSDGTPLDWTCGKELIGTTGNDGWHYLDIVGLPSGIEIPIGETISTNDETAFVTGLSEVDGAVRVYTTRALLSGSVEIGVREKVVMRMTNWPRASQTTGGYRYEIAFVEEFESVSGPFTVKDPWR